MLSRRFQKTTLKIAPVGDEMLESLLGSKN
jgi:hypothetical protein